MSKMHPVLLRLLSATEYRKLRSDSLLNADPRAHVLVAPPGADQTEYSRGRGGRRGGRGRGRRGRRGGDGKMEVD